MGLDAGVLHGDPTALLGDCHRVTIVRTLLDRVHDELEAYTMGLKDDGRREEAAELDCAGYLLAIARQELEQMQPSRRDVPAARSGPVRRPRPGHGR